MDKFNDTPKGSFSALFFLLLAIWPLESYASRAAFSHEDLNVQLGQAIFEKLWVFAPSSTKSSDGLGPLYNARSCAQCHAPANKATKSPVSEVIMLSIEPQDSENLSEQYESERRLNGFISEPTYGKQLQIFAYPGAPAEADVNRRTHRMLVSLSDQQELTLQHTEITLHSPAYGEFNAALRISARTTPRLQGLGLLDSISDSLILSLEDPEDRNADGISGRANRVWDKVSNSQRIGRFGWKAGKASLEQQNLAALATDIGVSSWLFPDPAGDCTLIQTHCTALANSTHTTINGNHPDIEASKEMTDLLLDFTRVVGQSALTAHANTLKAGKRLFDETGCLSCHSDYFNVTVEQKGWPKDVTPYSDLLLHDMGQALADNRQEFQANGREWRTTPLWGIAHYLKQTATPSFLHDGRAGSVLEAILWHGGEAERSKHLFMALPNLHRQQLIDFVEAL